MSERAALFAALLSLSACGYAPARYAAAPPVLDARDDRAIPLPEPRLDLDELYDAEAYLDAGLVEGLEVSLPPRALDVNSLDDVVRSSWFRGGAIGLEGYLRKGPPLAPLVWVQDAEEPIVEGSSLAEDARGLRYQLVYDLPGLASSRTTAFAVASRLVHALGYRVVEAHRTVTPGGRPAVALRWPVGRDLGPTPMLWTRADDPNDVLSHVGRRSLRAFWVAAAWLGIDRFEESTFRDVYVGAPGRGHVEHFVVDLNGALGVARLERNIEAAFDASRDDVGFFGRLGSLGLTPLPPPPSTRRELPGAGQLPAEVAPDFGISPPFAPHRRMRPDDAYWLAARMLAISGETLDQALRAGGLEQRDRVALGIRLRERRVALARQIFATVSPIDLLTAVGDHLLLRDVEVAAGIERDGLRGYRAVLVDGDGDPLPTPVTITVRGARLVVKLPAPQADYEVLRLFRLDDDEPRPRALEIHLAREPRLALRGLRH